MIKARQEDLAKHHANSARVIRTKQSRGKGNGCSQLVIPTPELLEAHEEQARAPETWNWPHDPKPAPLAGVLARVRIHLPDSWVLSLVVDRGQVLLSPPQTRSLVPRSTMTTRGRLMVPLRGTSDRDITSAILKLLARAGLDPEAVQFRLVEEKSP